MKKLVLMAAIMAMMAGCKTTEEWHYQGNDVVSAVEAVMSQGKFTEVCVKRIADDEYMIGAK